MLKILHADDDQNDAWLVRSALSKAQLPVSIETVRDGRRTIEYLEDQLDSGVPGALPHLLLLDLKLPGLDGIAVLGYLRGEDRLRKMKVYVLTSSDSARDKDTALRLGADKYLVKSPHFTDLVQAVAELVPASEGGTAVN
jgi:CheY-like chemotaxis protein